MQHPDQLFWQAVYACSAIIPIYSQIKSLNHKNQPRILSDTWLMKESTHEIIRHRIDSIRT